jgi:hypothetical protein
MMFPKVGVLLVTPSHNVRPTEGLIGNGQMGIERGAHVVTRDKDAR